MTNLDNPRWLEWTDKFLQSQKAPMTEDVAQSMLMCVMAEQSENTFKNFENGVLRDGMKLFPFQVFSAHANKIGLKVNAAVLAFICASGVAPNAGTLVMYAHALRRLQMLNGGKTVTMRDLTMGPFAMGFPAEPVLQQLWESQKLTMDQRTGMGDNFLDTVVA